MSVLISVEMLRSQPPELRPSSEAVMFVGGMLGGQIRSLPTTVDDDGLLPFNGLSHGHPVRHVYRLTGWRPDPGVWVYALTDGR
jgi:hypothetical protein